MAAAMLTKQFMGQTLKGSVAPLQPTQAPRAVPVQAFFKKAEKSAKRAVAPAKGNATQVSRSLAPDHARTENAIRHWQQPILARCRDPSGGGGLDMHTRTLVSSCIGRPSLFLRRA